MGGDIKEYQILLDPGRMRHYGVSLDEVVDAVKGMNQNAPGGTLYQYGNEYIVRGILSTDEIGQLRKAVVKMGAGGLPVPLEAVAEVRTGPKTPVLGVASNDGRPAVILTVTKQPNTSTLALTDRLDRELDDIRTELPADVRVNADIFRQSRFIEGAIGNVKKSLLEGGLFVILVLFVFLMNWRTTVISLVSIPLSILITLLVTRWMGMTVNTMSLGGIAIAIGSLVDDSIVDVENVFKRLRQARGQGKDVLKVVFEASREVRMPMLNSTLIIIACFLPLFFLSGMEGRMLKPLGITFIISLLTSTLVALTLTPVLSSFLLAHEMLPAADGRASREAPVVRWLKKHYSTALEWTIGHRRGVLALVGVLLLTAVAMFFTLGRSFLPAFNEGSLTIAMSSVPGISIETSDRLGRQAEELLMSIPEIRTVGRKTGRAELDEHAFGVNSSEFECPFVLNGKSRRQLMDEVREKLSVLPGVNIEIGGPISHRIDAMLSGTQAGIAIKLFGTDLNKMYGIGMQIKSAISDIDGIVDVNVEQQVERPELNIVPRREMLARHGITLPEFAEFVRIMLAGEPVSTVY